MLLLASGLFTLGSLACALALSMPALVAVRALPGLGGGGLMSLSMLAVVASFPPAERGRRMGGLGAAYSLATLLGHLARPLGRRPALAACALAGGLLAECAAGGAGLGRAAQRAVEHRAGGDAATRTCFARLRRCRASARPIAPEPQPPIACGPSGPMSGGPADASAQWRQCGFPHRPKPSPP